MCRGNVFYIGYGGGRSLLGDWTAIPSTGVAHFVMDLRGQGAGHKSGDTPDPGVGGPHLGGFLTLGIDDPEQYYYRRLFTDAVRAVEAALVSENVADQSERTEEDEVSAGARASYFQDEAERPGGSGPVGGDPADVGGVSEPVAEPDTEVVAEQLDDPEVGESEIVPPIGEETSGEANGEPTEESDETGSDAEEDGSGEEVENEKGQG